MIPALVFGRYLTALGTVRSLGGLGIPAYCVTGVEPFIARSRHYRPPPGGLGRIDEPAGLTSYLRDLPIPRAVPIACADHWVLALSRIDAELSERFPTSMPSPDVLDALVDKGNLLEVLDRFEVGRPETLFLDEEDDLQPIEDDPERTWFLKPADSRSFRTHFRVKAFMVRSLDEAVQRFREIRREGLTVLLQEYIPGPASSHYFVDGFVDRGGAIKGLLARRRIRMHPLDFGDSSYMTTVSLAAVPDAVDALRRLLPGIGYRGVFSAEFKRDPRDERLKLIEVNTRPWAYVEFATTCGLNTPWMAYRDALGLEVPSAEDYPVGRSMCVLPNDLRACLALRRQGKLSWSAWLRSWIGVQQAVFHWRDPLPSVYRLLSSFRSRSRGRGG